MKHKTFIYGVALTGLLLILSGCHTVPKNIPADLSADELINLAQASYDKGNTRAAQVYYETILIRYGDQMDKVVEAEYEIAHMKVKQKKWQQAIPDLQRVVSYYETDTTGTLPPAFRKLAELDMAKVPERELIKAGLMEAPNKVSGTSESF